MKQPPNPPQTIQYVISNTKYIHSYEQQQQQQSSSSNGNNVLSMKIKEEPESPTIRSNLPATPKSNEAQLNESESGEAVGEESGNYAETNESMTFVLAPTPAQLGKAPLQRRQNQRKFDEFLEKEICYYLKIIFTVHSASSMEDMTSLIETMTTASAPINAVVPSALPTPTSAEDVHAQMSPSIKGKSYKKLKTDDMDK
jgi:hypothetical protein